MRKYVKIVVLSSPSLPKGVDPGLCGGSYTCSVVYTTNAETGEPISGRCSRSSETRVKVKGERSRRHRINPIPLNPSKNQKAGCSPGSLRRETNMKTKWRQSTYIQSAVLVTEPVTSEGEAWG